MQFIRTGRSIIFCRTSSRPIPSHPQLVPGSGHGWQLFRVEARDGTAEKPQAKKEALEDLLGPKSDAGAINPEEFTGNARQQDEREQVGKGSVRVELRAVRELDYENPDHRRGFRFRLQVTDKVSGVFYTRFACHERWFLIYLFVYLSVYFHF